MYINDERIYHPFLYDNLFIIKAYTQGERVNRSCQIPDPYAMTISDVTNLRCIDGGGIKMGNAIKLSGKLLAKKGKVAIKLFLS